MEKKTLLIVDDQADTRLVLSPRLKAHHYHTVFAADALQAMSVALKERPDAILLDLGLPGGNGLMVLERFKANISMGCTPIIIVTAEDPLVAEARIIKAGAASSFKSPWIKTRSWRRCSKLCGNNLRPVLKSQFFNHNGNGFPTQPSHGLENQSGKIG